MLTIREIQGTLISFQPGDCFRGRLTIRAMGNRTVPLFSCQPTYRYSQSEVTPLNVHLGHHRYKIIMTSEPGREGILPSASPPPSPPDM